MMKLPLIFDIKTFAVHDGPGVRTTFFLKGCPLHCKWCQNPESIDPAQYLAYNSLLCQRCGACRTVCDKLGDDFMLPRADCTLCGKCIEACVPAARKFAGQTLTPEELTARALSDKLFFETSDGGGVTFSGGECLLHADYLRECLTLLKAEGIHTCIDTCGAVPREHFEKILPFSDLFLYDIKKIDPVLHKEYTGRDNVQILENLRFLCAEKKEVIIRVPLIPGYTDSEEDIRAIARFVSEELHGAIRRVELLPYNKLAESKYTNNTAYRDGGLSYPLGDLTAQTNEYVSGLARILDEYGVPAFSEVL